MKLFLILMLGATSLLWGLVSCTIDASVEEQGTIWPTPPDTSGSGEKDQVNGDSVSNKITIKIGDSVFTATLSDRAPAMAFKAMMPMSVRMDEHGGNEKYYNLSESLPTEGYRPETIHVGDLMLWGNDCIVLFYKRCSTSYRYTRLGSVDNPSGLTEIVGDGSITVTFE